jgi:uncharacterized membrane protein
MKDANANARLEALCDAVFAIAMTLLVIELRAPNPEAIHSAADLWAALWNDAPTIGAFLLSFTIIFITWANHHAVIRSVPRTSAKFLFANGFLLLTIAFIPFPTALLGQFVLSNRAAPAVVLYNAVLAAQAAAWILITRTALRDELARDEEAQSTLRMNKRSAYGAMVLYSLLSITAMRLPTVVAILTTASWIVWLVMSLRAKHT